jgi:acetyltransferase-like isoleucine patch superfamily enzyme
LIRGQQYRARARHRAHGSYVSAGLAHGRRRAARLASYARWCKIMKGHRHTVIAIPSDVHIGAGFRLVVSGSGRLTVGAGVIFRHGTIIEIADGSAVTIGARTVFTYHNVIQSVAGVDIGAGCLFAAFASVVDGAHRPAEAGLSLPDAGYVPRPIAIGDDVWVASKSTINADVGSGAVVGANSLVNRTVPAGARVGGVPARVLR